MNTKKKGDAVEKKFYDTYKERYPEHLTMKAQRTMKRVYIKGKLTWVSQANDFFGLFDMVSFTKHSIRFWYQIKSNISDVSTFKKKFLEKTNYFENETVVCVLYVPRKGYVHYLFDNFNKEWFKHYTNLKLMACEPFKITK